MPEAANVENPQVPLSLAEPTDEVFAALGATRSPSGVRVSAKRSLGYPAVWRAVNLISGDVGKLPLRVYRIQGRNRQFDESHPAYRLLFRKPNGMMTAFTFRQTLQANVLLRGNGYAYIDRSGSGSPLALIPLDPLQVEPIVADGQLWYVYSFKDTAERRRIPAEDILHIKGLGYDGIQGYDVISYHRDSLGVAIAARDFSGRYFRNSARPGGAIEHPKVLTEVARNNIRESWERIHKGFENAHKVAILEEGAKYVAFAADARSAQLLENREFDAREIANIFGVPTHKLGDPSKVAYNSLEQENQSYYDDTLSRWLRLWSEECHDKLLTEREKSTESHTIDFDYNEIQRANLSAQIDFVSKGISCGLLSQDEGRGFFGLNPIPGETGDDYYMAANIQKIGANSAEPPEPTVDTEALADAARALARESAARMAKRLGVHALKHRKEGTFGPWVASGAPDHRGVIGEAMLPLSLLLRSMRHDVASSEVLAASLTEIALKRFSECENVEASVLDSVIEFVDSLFEVPNA